jgi:RHS repeat-associated protein
MISPQQNQLCSYRYDPLDRLVSQAKPQESTLQRFYCKSRVVTEVQGTLHHSIVQHDEQLLAQQQRQDGVSDTMLLATDQQRSILHTLKPNHQRQPFTYSPYGYRQLGNGLLSLLGFNGERLDPVIGNYLLGNGNRAFNPVLMRFNSPDRLSPFGKGGLNSYAYCSGDPINLYDPDGHSAVSVFKLVQASVRFRRLLNVKTARQIELAEVKRTGVININVGSRQARLKPSITPEKAIEMRDKVNRLASLGSIDRFRNHHFLSELSLAKREAVLLNKELGLSIAENSRLKLLNYIKGDPGEGLVFSFKRLHQAERGVFDPSVPLRNRPDIQEASMYMRQLTMAALRSAPFYEEAYRIRSIYFD